MCRRTHSRLMSIDQPEGSDRQEETSNVCQYWSRRTYAVAGQWFFSTFTNIYLQVSCKVSIRSSKQLANVIGKQQFTDENALLGTDRVSGLFPSPEGPAEGVVHIVIQLPACESSPCLNRSFRERWFRKLWSSRDPTCQPTSLVTTSTATRLASCISCSF